MVNEEYMKRALEKINDKDLLVLIASKRAKQLVKGAKQLVKCDEDDYLNIALLEIAEGAITYEFPEGEKEKKYLDIFK